MKVNFIGVICITLVPYAVAGPEMAAKDKAGNVYYKLTPDERLHFCCRSEKVPREGIPKKCYNVCYYKNISGKRILDEVPRCGTDALYYMLGCAARFDDHTDCCRQAGVQSKCLVFCRPTLHVDSGGALPPDLDCLNDVDKMKVCFRDFDMKNPAWMRKEEYTMATRAMQTA